LLFWAATAKSAQIPLYVWLPDAMEGPTPVSALIHAATMVTAGVYLIARSTPLFALVPNVQALVAVVGCATALLSAAIALTQNDLKRVMAYSTVSQLGYMFMGLGAGVGDLRTFAVVAAMFHLFTHAFFKALLFLSSGSVMHAMGGVIDMRRFSGLRHRMPVTHWTFLAGGLALAGIPPLAGFWSKDEILTALKRASSLSADWGQVYVAVYWLAVLTAFLTAFYTGRAYFRTFWGPEKLPSPDDPEALDDDAGHGAADDAHGHGHGHDDGHGAADDHGHGAHFGHESPPVMTYPLIILAACAVFVGLLFGPLTGGFEHHLERTYGIEGFEHEVPTTLAVEHHDVAHGPDWMTMAVSTVVGLAGAFLSYQWYGRPSTVPTMLSTRFRRLYQASYNKFYVDELYQRLAVLPTRVLADVSAFVDTYLVDGLVRGTAWLPRLLARGALAPLQNGLIQFYVSVTAFVVALLLVILLFVPV
jgi:NADH-quinone oxidoreductase subunit L